MLEADPVYNSMPTSVTRTLQILMYVPVFEAHIFSLSFTPYFAVFLLT